jgi:hypothetical protein
MFTKRLSKVFLFGISLFVLLVLVGHNPGLLASIATVTPTPAGLFTSPLPTPLASTPTSPPPSAEAQVALRYVSERYGIPKEQLDVVNEHRLEYAELGRAFRAFSLFDPIGRRYFQLLVDLKDHTVVEDIVAIDQAEAGAARKKYGKLEPSLYERFQTIQDNDVVAVTIRMVGGSRLGTGDIAPTVIATIAAKYPEARAAVERSGKPMDVGDPTLAARIEKDYRDVMDALVAQQEQPLIEARKRMAAELKGQGIIIRADGGSDLLTKREVLLIVQRDDVGAIDLAEGGRYVLESSVVPANQPLSVWERFFRGGSWFVAAVVLWGLALPLIYLSRRTDRPMKRRLPWVIFATATALTLPLFYLIACRPQEQTLTFETVAQRDIINYREDKSALFVIAKVEEIDDHTQNVLAEDPTLVNQLRALDYNRVFAVLVLHGYVGSSNYSVTVQKVTQQGDQVIIRADFVGPTPGTRIKPAFTSPYHLIAVSKKGGAFGQQIRFVLMKEDKPVAESTHFIP